MTDRMRSLRTLSLSVALVACSGPSADAADPAVPEGRIEPAPPVPPGQPQPVASTSASAPPIDPPPTLSLPVDDVGRENAFTAALYQKVASSSQGNVFVSPASVRLALGMIYAGAGGKTADEISAAARFAGGVDKTGEAAKAEIAGWKAFASDKVELTIANRLFVEKTFTPEKSFTDSLTGSWGAGLETLDFIKASEASRKAINAWAKKETKDRIIDLMPSGSVDGSTRLVVADAVYFNGKWSTAFDKKETAKAPWNPGHSDKASTASFMHRSAHYRYGEMTGAKLCEIPYGKGDLAMVVVLPDDATGLSKIEGKLDFANLATMRSRLADTKVDLALPSFGMSFGGSQKENLESLGMKAAFTDGADFTRMNKAGGLKLTNVFHKTFIKVDESGTEAAAATAGGVSVLSAELAKPFRADHPFLFLLEDTSSGRVLFIGRVIDPTKS